MSILCEKMMSLSMKNDFMTNQIYFIYFREMWEKEKMREDFCQDCELWTQIDNCRDCLFNVLCNK